jgi:uncharacterized coiled-coil protein SlyX
MNATSQAAQTSGDTPQNQAEMDWNHIRETVQMLNLAVAQIEMSMRDGDDSVDALTHSFTSMAGGVQVIERASRELGDDPGRNLPNIEAILKNCQQISGKMQQAIVAFQFYDKLTQRLSHVADSLAAVGDLVDDPARLHSRFEWYGVQEKIRSKYTMEQERAMFDALMNGATIQDALGAFAAPAEDDVELF